MKRIFTLFLLNLLFGYSFANDPIILKVLNQPINFDGIPDEKAWETIEALPLVTHMPVFGKEPSEKSIIKIAYDQDYLYLAGNLYTSDPSQIQAKSKKRDAMVGNTDWFGIVIDSYNDRENALAFFTNPNGLRLDVNVFNDAIGQLPINTSWNTFWDVKTIIREDGWHVEMRIPFSSLQFQSTDEEVIMGITTWRWMAKKNEMIVYPAIPPDWGDWSAWKPSNTQRVILKNVQSRKPFYIAPYVLGGYNQNFELDATESHYEKYNDPSFDAGLDLKYGITNNITLDVSVNTDFAQVEADDQQINLTRSSLFFPEKRLFFQERSGIFSFNFGPGDNLFYSRRIGIKDDQQVPIYGGVRLVGRTGKWDMGLMNMQTAALDSIVAENFSVLRLRRQVFNENSDAGLILTNRMDFKGNYSANYGFDATIRLWKQDFLSIRLAQTLQNDYDYGLTSLDPTRFWLSLSRRQFTGFTYGVSISRSGVDFNPSVGFQGRENFTRQGMRLTYGWIAGEKSKLLRHGPVYRGVFFFSNTTNQLETYRGGLNWEYVFKTGWTGQIGGTYQYESLVDPLELTDVITILPGEYRFQGFSTMLISPQSVGFSVISELNAGSFYDGNRFSVILTPTFAVSASLELSGTYEYNRLSFPDRNLQENIHVGRLKALYMLDTKFSVSSFIQYNSTINTFLANVRLRYNPREGNDFYIVYNDDFNTARDRELPWHPRLPVSNQRTLILKYTYTFRL
jgi:hypothetical protein